MQPCRSGPGVERCHQVAWKMFRRNQDNVEAHVEIRMIRMSHQPHLRRRDNPLLLLRGYRVRRVIESGPGFNLYKRQQPASPRDDIDFAIGVRKRRARIR